MRRIMTVGVKLTDVGQTGLDREVNNPGLSLVGNSTNQQIIDHFKEARLLGQSVHAVIVGSRFIGLRKTEEMTKR